jgi:hypothetical protein
MVWQQKNTLVVGLAGGERKLGRNSADVAVHVGKMLHRWGFSYLQAKTSMSANFNSIQQYTE